VVSFVKLLLVITWGILCGLWVYSNYQERRTSTYASPLYCFNDTDHFKSDVCSKIGKTWDL
jgi:hypothetical protein